MEQLINMEQLASAAVQQGLAEGLEKWIRLRTPHPKKNVIKS